MPASPAGHPVNRSGGDGCCWEEMFVNHRADYELTRRAAQADSGAFDRLFGETLDRVHSFVARRSTSQKIAERVTERVLLRAFETLERYDGSVPLAAWLLSLVKQELRAESNEARAASRPSGTTPAPPASGV
jgi:DNA-directed RNA polymerase specialized sigma24 family protein